MCGVKVFCTIGLTTVAWVCGVIVYIGEQKNDAIAKTQNQLISCPVPVRPIPEVIYNEEELAKKFEKEWESQAAGYARF